MHTENRELFSRSSAVLCVSIDVQACNICKFEIRLIGQSFSAFCASSLEDVSAVSSRHSLSEAVLLFSLTLFGLIGSEHLLAPP